MRKLLQSGFLATAVALAAAAHAGTVRSDEHARYRPTGKGSGELDLGPGAAARAAATARVRGHGIQYHGGPVMNDAGGVNVYLIWYGDWSGNTAVPILSDLASAIGGSPYYNINTTYTDGALNPVKNIVHLAGSASDAYSHGANLGDADVQAIVAAAIPALGGTPDPNGVYFVLTSADVNESSGFCTQYCGWHTRGTIAGTTVKFSFVGNPDRCPSACTNGTPPPNGNAGADGMASVVAHELEEAASDPELDAWYDFRGRENADKCAWTFGATYTTGGGGLANMNLGGRDFLIQQNWLNASGRGACALAF